MSDLLDEFVIELLETGSTGSKDYFNYTPPMYKRTPGKWTWEYVPDKGYALCVNNPEDNSEGELHPTNGDMQLMSYSAEMYRLLYKIAAERLLCFEVDNLFNEITQLLAKIYVEPPEDIDNREGFIDLIKSVKVKASRNTGA